MNRVGRFRSVSLVLESNSWRMRSIVSFCLILCAALISCDKQPRSAPVTVERDANHNVGEVRFTGHIYPRRYNERKDRANGHHAIVWRGGNSASKALIEADTADVEIQDALEKLGLKPADNLKPEAWTQRDDPDDLAPDERVKGPPLRITVTWDGLGQPMELWRLFRNTTAGDVRIHFGGHRASIDRWRSGCITCLFSCPGGRTSNAAFTIRDQARDRRSFMANQEKLPPDGTTVEVTIQPAEATTAPAGDLDEGGIDQGSSR